MWARGWVVDRFSQRAQSPVRGSVLGRPIHGGSFRKLHPVQEDPERRLDLTVQHSLRLDVRWCPGSLRFTSISVGGHVLCRRYHRLGLRDQGFRVGPTKRGH